MVWARLGGGEGDLVGNLRFDDLDGDRPRVEVEWCMSLCLGEGEVGSREVVCLECLSLRAVCLEILVDILEVGVVVVLRGDRAEALASVLEGVFAGDGTALARDRGDLAGDCVVLPGEREALTGD